MTFNSLCFAFDCDFVKISQHIQSICFKIFTSSRLKIKTKQFGRHFVTQGNLKLPFLRPSVNPSLSTTLCAIINLLCNN